MPTATATDPTPYDDDWQRERTTPDWDRFRSDVSGAYDSVAGFFDHAAGSMDESIARQFDDTPGGGFADWDTWAGIGDHAAGSTDEWVGRWTSALGSVGEAESRVDSVLEPIRGTLREAEGPIQVVLTVGLALTILYLLQPVLKTIQAVAER